MAAACGEVGAGRVTVTHVVSHAGVSRRTFYEVFKDREECLMAALQEALRRGSERVLPAYQAQKTWRGAVRAGIEELLGFLDEDRTLSRLLIVDSLAAGPRVQTWRAKTIEKVGEAIVSDGRMPRTVGEPALGASSVVAGVLAALHTRLAAQPEAPVSPLAGELTAMVLLPYLGRGAAVREAQRKAPRRRAPAAVDQRDLLASSQLRLTYRTVRVLAAIAELEGSGRRGCGPSNRQIAEASGITDQGQVSKMLARLARSGLISNRHRDVTGRREPNAWTLTTAGTQVERAIANSSELRGEVASPRKPSQRPRGSALRGPSSGR